MSTGRHFQHSDDFLTLHDEDPVEDALDLCDATGTPIVVVESLDAGRYELFGCHVDHLRRLDVNQPIGEALRSGGFTVPIQRAGRIPVDDTGDGLIALIEPGQPEENRRPQVQSIGFFTDGFRKDRNTAVEPIVLNVEGPGQVAADSELRITISLDSVAFDGAATAELLGDPGEVFHCVVSTFGAKTLVGPKSFPLQLAGDIGASRQVKIEIGATDAHVLIRLFRDDTTLAACVQHTFVVGEHNVGVLVSETVEVVGADGPSLPKADMRMIVTHVNDEGQSVLSFTAAAGDGPLHDLGEQRLQATPQLAVEQFFTTLGTMRAGRADVAERELQIRGIGDLIFDLLPPAAQAFFYEGATQNTDNPPTLAIHTDEPWVPWELAQVHGRPDHEADIEERGPLCMLFDLARSTGNTDSAPRLTGPIGLIRVDDSRLQAADKDVEAVKRLAAGVGTTLESVKARSGPIYERLRDTEFSLIHFVGHGKRQTTHVDRISLTLNHNKEISTSMLLSPRVRQNIKRANTFVFLNTCNGGAGTMELGQMAGWGNAFVRAGASGFLGCYWAVTDTLAGLFAERFYDYITREPVARAVRLARKDVLEATRTQEIVDPTWLAYTLLADPTATFSSARSASVQ